MNYCSVYLHCKGICFTILTFLIAMAIMCMISCSKNEILSLPNYSLQYSVEQIDFDTLFTETGSIACAIKLYNPHKGSLLIEAIELLQGSNSQYILNVTGVSRTIRKNAET